MGLESLESQEHSSAGQLGAHHTGQNFGRCRKKRGTAVTAILVLLAGTVYLNSSLQLLGRANAAFTCDVGYTTETVSGVSYCAICPAGKHHALLIGFRQGMSDRHIFSHSRDHLQLSFEVVLPLGSYGLQDDSNGLD